MADLLQMLSAAAGAAGGENPYIEDVFSTYLYTGNGSTQTITNDIDLDGEGGLVWIKQRSPNAGYAHRLIDTARGATKELVSNDTEAEVTRVTGLTAFNGDGFSLGSTATYNEIAAQFASWTFRKAPKFFDVVTYTGDGVAGRQIEHNLGSAPGMVIVKSTSHAYDWECWHRALPTDYVIRLNEDGAAFDEDTYGINFWNDTAPTSTHVTLGDYISVNNTGYTYVMYVFAHDAGGFGDDGEQNVISCGSYTGNGSTTGPVITLGYEPQWLMVKKSSGTGDWVMVDNMRGIVTGGIDPRLWANLNNAENTGDNLFKLNATGFQPESLSDSINASSATYIYIAIRRGPMKTPESGTEVFAMDVGDGSSVPAFTGGFPIDMALYRSPTNTDNTDIGSRLTGTNKCKTNLTDAETADGDWDWDYQNGWYGVVQSSDFQSWMFQRAPKFMDVVCYTGTGSATTFSHNLGVVPELMIVKSRSNIQNWPVYSSAVGNTGYLLLNNTDAAVTGVSGNWNDTTPTATVFTVGADNRTNNTSWTYVAYLFASLAGVSDIGTYTGNGSSVSVTTGFQPRFILVKRTDSTGNWIYGDSVRGLVAGDDPFLLLNSTAAQTTGQDWVDVSATGFTVNETAANANVNTGTYLYLAIS